MRVRGICLALAFLTIAIAPAVADDVYNNGPINGNTDAWTVNFGFMVSDSFTISAGNTTLNGFSFGAWVEPGDVLESAELSFSSQTLNSGTIYFDQVVNFTQSGCAVNAYGYDVCTETTSFSGPTLPNGTYWVNLQNAVSQEGNPVYWDENSGVGCSSPGCPSVANTDCIMKSDAGCIPSESFTIFGNTTSTTATTPEPSSILLFGSGFFGLIGLLRRKRS